jgi:hypothetical protein
MFKIILYFSEEITNLTEETDSHFKKLIGINSQEGGNCPSSHVIPFKIGTGRRRNGSNTTENNTYY